MNNNIFNAIDAQPQQLRESYNEGLEPALTPQLGSGIRNIVLAGMGGSALAGGVIKNWLDERLSVPFETVRDYKLPSYIDTDSLVIVSSYSGNTEETLSACEFADKMSAQIVIMTHGGTLLEQAQKEGNWLLELPQAEQPRFAVLADLKAMACLLQDLGLAGSIDLRRELIEVANFLDRQKSTLNLDSDSNNLAAKIAAQLTGKPALIYASPLISSTAYKWKININEDAKQMAFCNVFPELDHNELEGWLLPKEKQLNSVLLRSSLETAQMQKRIDATKEVLKGHGFEPIEVKAVGETRLQQLLYVNLLGDYVSAYLAQANHVDPLPVKLVEELKAKLK
ncbi:bifunctional phosphoglucose/phosphomannose isomerase [Candidatus Saccharibacteria bacterium]|nr:bifunctional phosphoglucose/phosphomannose isomerase [Candidatus Saccharibacteria bacterium]